MNLFDSLLFSASRKKENPKRIHIKTIRGRMMWSKYQHNEIFRCLLPLALFRSASLLRVLKSIFRMRAHDRLNRWPIATKSYSILVRACMLKHLTWMDIVHVDIIHTFRRKSVNRLHRSSFCAPINILNSLRTQSDSVVSTFYYTFCIVIYDFSIGSTYTIQRRI